VSLRDSDDAGENIGIHVGSPGIRAEYYLW